MIKGTALIFIATVPVYQDISAEGVLGMFYPISISTVALVVCPIHHIPRPFGLGELAGFRVSGWNLDAAIVVSSLSTICRTPITRLGA
jgi:hypothetical protein